MKWRSWRSIIRGPDGRLSVLVGLPLMLLLTGTVVATGQEALSNEAQKTAEKRREGILAEVRKLGDHQWAGDYYSGDGLGMNIYFAIAPRSGYVFEWHGCLGLYGLNYGSVVWTNSRIILSFTYKNPSGFGGISAEFIPVWWRLRRYLVPAEDIVGFCNEVNQGREPRADVHGKYLLRRGDEQKNVTGFPDLPEDYRPYLLTKPVEATIIAVGPYKTRPSISTWNFKDTPVTLNVGTNGGLRVGMELIVTEPETVIKSVQLTRVMADESEGVKCRCRNSSGKAIRTGYRNRHVDGRFRSEILEHGRFYAF